MKSKNLINKLFILLVLLGNTLYGCTLCTIYSPETKFYVKLQGDDKTIKSANITWVLTKEFTNSLKDMYDGNANNFLDKDELAEVGQSLYDYIVPKNYLTFISYGKTINKKNSLPIKLLSKKLYVKNSILHFDYSVKLDLPVVKDNALYIKINDDESFFILVLSKNYSKSLIPDSTILEGINDDIIFNFASGVAVEKVETKEKEIIAPSKEPEQIEEVKVEEEKKEPTWLQVFVQEVKKYLVRIEQGDNFALITLLFVSFIYGVLHALGPGHGKSLAFSYFMTNKSSYMRAFWISQASAFIHIVGALILVVISIFVLQSLLNNFVKDSVEILTKVSAVMIIGLALYILYNKLNKKSCSCSSCCSTPKPAWSTTKPEKTTSLKPNFMKQDLYFVLTAGLIPCPGTVVLFIYAFVLKTYFAVILAAICISLGMGLVIFVSSFLGVSLKKYSSGSHKLTNFFEILAPVVMFVLGVLLFMNAKFF